MPWRQQTRPLSRARLAGLREEWLGSVGFFCAMLTFFLGLTLLLDPLVRTVAPANLFHRWGEGGVVAIGVVFVGVALWDTLITTRRGYATTVIVLSGFGILSSLRPLNPASLVFYLLALIATFHPQPFRHGRG